MERDLRSAYGTIRMKVMRSDIKAVEKNPVKFRKQTGPDWFSLAWLVVVDKTETQSAARWKRVVYDS